MRKFLGLLVVTVLTLPIVTFAQGVAWGPAGAPQDVGAAHIYFQTGEDVPMTKVNHPEPDQSLLVIGWIIGTSDTEAQGTRYTSVLPAGVCVDFDPNATEFDTAVGILGEYSPRWWRTVTVTETIASSLKITAYNTPCNWDGATVPPPGR